MTEIESAIVATVARARAANLEPRALYLVPDDVHALERLGHAETIGGLPIKRSSPRGRSRLYCRGGITMNVSSRPRRPLRPYARASSSTPAKPRRGKS